MCLPPYVKTYYPSLVSEQFHALILAAGQGTRMKSAVPKVLHPLLGRPLLDYPVRLARELGAESTVIVVGHRAEAVEQAFANQPALRFARQPEPKGTGHAVASARGSLPEQGTVLILTGDTPLLQSTSMRDFLTAHFHSGTPITVLAADYPDPTGYGRILLDDRGVARIVEHRDATASERKITLCNTGFFVCDLAVLWRLIARLEPNNAQGEYYFTDIVALARREGFPVAWHRAPDYREFLGINDREQLAQAAGILQQRILERHRQNGVTINNDSGVYIEAGVVIGRDTVIEAGVHLGGETVLGEGCMLEAGVRVEGCRLGDNVRVKAYSVLEDSVVAAGCIIGPFAHLRPGTQLAEDVHIGNFVETKKTSLGKGSKANHLTYLGDAIVGAEVNVGAGTITCNYDGEKKHQTVIEDGAFIGSDTQLVAPVRVGKRAVVGAGTTVTHDVPDEALAVSRPPQKNIEGYRSRRLKKRVTP